MCGRPHRSTHADVALLFTYHAFIDPHCLAALVGTLLHTDPACIYSPYIVTFEPGPLPLGTHPFYLFFPSCCRPCLCHLHHTPDPPLPHPNSWPRTGTGSLCVPHCWDMLFYRTAVVGEGVVHPGHTPTHCAHPHPLCVVTPAILPPHLNYPHPALPAPPALPTAPTQCHAPPCVTFFCVYCMLTPYFLAFPTPVPAFPLPMPIPAVLLRLFTIIDLTMSHPSDRPTVLPAWTDLQMDMAWFCGVLPGFLIPHFYLMISDWEEVIFCTFTLLPHYCFYLPVFYHPTMDTHAFYPF